MTPGSELTWLGRSARAASGLLLAYWAVYALLSPITNFDSQMYNLARVELAWRGGFFGNVLFTSIYHVIWPWSFDALHLPFVLLGWGAALPSFLCLVGTCHVMHTMVRTRFGPDAAWAGVLALLSMPCLVYQATSTKNDIPLLFTGAVWLYARWRHQREGRHVHLVWMVLALGLMAGSKTTGLVFAGLLGLWTLWECRSSGTRRLSQVAGGLGLSLLLFGSIETYAESQRLFSRPLGPESVAQRHQARGNLSERAQNLLQLVAQSAPEVSGRLLPASWPGATLAMTRYEEYAGYGAPGAIALGLFCAAIAVWRPRAPWWRLAMGGVSVLVLIGGMAATYSSSNRYILPAITLGAAATIAWLWDPARERFKLLRTAFLLLIMAGAFAAPLLSFNRRPADLVACVMDRERFATCSYPLAGRLRERLRVLHQANPGRRVFFVACIDSVILPYLQSRGVPITVVTPPNFSRLLAAGVAAPGDLVAQDCPAETASLIKVEEVSAPEAFAEGKSRTQVIYRIIAPATNNR